MGGVDGGGRLVLVVEDNEKNRKLARDLLSFRGFRVAEATTATDALIAARAEPPDLVLMDVALPDMDGVEALRLLRDDPLTSDVPVVAVTAFAMKGDRERLLDEGFDGYVAKPIDVRTFVDALLSIRNLGTPG
ncbi:MAG TPA: response regulator [Acidimicrobiales bacterium]|jgi:two-component system cell cycle response regulator DivK|nr:response regulator [Acidimicrobiales bacterium]